MVCGLHRWYDEFADRTWSDDKPNWVDCREHAKCLRSPEEVRTYFKSYRAQKRELVRYATGSGSQKTMLFCPRIGLREE